MALLLPDAACIGSTPQLLTATFVEVVRSLFANSNCIGQTNLKDLVWSADAAKSRILIEPARKWTTEAIQERPAIFIERGDWSLTPIGIGDIEQGAPDDTGFVEYRTVTQIKGSHLINCVSKTSAEAEALVTEVWEHFVAFAPNIRSQLNLGELRAVGLSGCKKAKESTEILVASVTLAYGFIHQATVKRLTPEWMRTNVTVTPTV